MTHPTIILRHRKENLKKCSLRGLEKRNDLSFYTYPTSMDLNLEGYVMLYLDPNSPKVLSQEDKNYGLFLLDSTWNYEKKMHDQILKNHPKIIYRSLPDHFVTAYPRIQTGCVDPEKGLATVEALYIAYKILDKNTEGLLDHYYFKEAFLEKNKKAFEELDILKIG